MEPIELAPPLIRIQSLGDEEEAAGGVGGKKPREERPGRTVAKEREKVAACSNERVVGICSCAEVSECAFEREGRERTNFGGEVVVNDRILLVSTCAG